MGWSSYIYPLKVQLTKQSGWSTKDDPWWSMDSQRVHGAKFGRFLGSFWDHPYCWWFVRNLAPVEVDSLSHYHRVFKPSFQWWLPDSEPSTVSLEEGLGVKDSPPCQHLNDSSLVIGPSGQDSKLSSVACTIWTMIRDSALLRGGLEEIKTSWWFQPIWKILVKLNHFPK